MLPHEKLILGVAVAAGGFYVLFALGTTLKLSTVSEKLSIEKPFLFWPTMGILTGLTVVSGVFDFFLNKRVKSMALSPRALGNARYRRFTAPWWKHINSYAFKFFLHLFVLIVIPAAVFLYASRHNRSQEVRLPVSIVAWYLIAEGARKEHLTGLHQCLFISASFCNPAAAEFTLAVWVAIYISGAFVLTISLFFGGRLEEQSPDDASENTPSELSWFVDIVDMMRDQRLAYKLGFALIHVFFGIGFAFFMHDSVKHMQLNKTLPFWAVLSVAIIIFIVSLAVETFPSLKKYVNSKSLKIAAFGSILSSIDALFKLIPDSADLGNYLPTTWIREHPWFGVTLYAFGLLVSAFMTFSDDTEEKLEKYITAGNKIVQKQTEEYVKLWRGIADTPSVDTAMGDSTGPSSTRSSTELDSLNSSGRRQNASMV